MKTLQQLFENAAPDRFSIEMLTNGLVRVFDRGAKTQCLFKNGEFHSGSYSKDAERAAKKFMDDYTNNPLDPYRMQPSRN